MSMPRRRSVLVPAAITALLVLSSAMALGQSGTEPPPTDERIEEAVLKACNTLKGLQREDGSWDDYPGYPGATTALAVQALALAGEPLDSATMKRAIVAMGSYNMEKTYSRACRAMAYAQLVRQYPELRAKLAGDATWLVRNQHPDGMWGYNEAKENKGRGDNSNTQFAVLGLRDASQANVEFSDTAWRRLWTHYTTTQLADGGWSYTPPAPPKQGEKSEPPRATVTVTAPSLASLMIVSDELLKTAGCPCSGKKSAGGKLDDASINKGTQWLIDYFEGKIKGSGDASKWMTYFYYGLQRAGQASGLKTFGKHDWYKRGSSAMFTMSKSDCLRPMVKGVDIDKDGKSLPPKDPNARPPLVVTRTNRSGEERKYVVEPAGVVNTSLAIIFLVKGNAPVYMNKLKYADDWNRHRRDLAIITEETAKRLERPFRWQVVDIEGDVDSWRDSPLLYMSGEEDLQLTDEQKKKLVEFCNQGGTLFIEANCGNPEFGEKARSLCKELWPDFPLQKLAAEHPIYNCQLPIEKTDLLEGIDDGVRAFVFYTERDVSCAWQMRDVVKNKPYFDLGVNLYAYATDKAPPPAKLAEIEQRIRDRVKAEEEGEAAVEEEKELAKKEDRKAKTIPKPAILEDKPPVVNIKKLKPGSKNLVTLGLLEHKGSFRVGMHYQMVGLIIADFQQKAGVTLAMGAAAPAGGIMPGMPDVLLVRGDSPMQLTDNEKSALVNYMMDGGFVIAEAAMGRPGFDADFRKFIESTGGKIKLVELGEKDPLVTGEIGEKIVGVEIPKPTFTRAVREAQPGLAKLPIMAIMCGDKLVGYYSPLDLTYSATGYGAYDLRGYDKTTALSTLVNMFLATTK